MNNSSSRSHAILSITLEQESTEIIERDVKLVSKLQLVDLAGSERSAYTGKTANKESIEINKSLFTLR